MKFENFQVNLPKHDADVEIIFPGGEKLIIQARPSNADEGYNGSLDIILPKPTAVTNWIDGMNPSPESNPNVNQPCTRNADQLVMELLGNYEA